MLSGHERLQCVPNPRSTIPPHGVNHEGQRSWYMVLSGRVIYPVTRHGEGARILVRAKRVLASPMPRVTIVSCIPPYVCCVSERGPDPASL